MGGRAQAVATAGSSSRQQRSGRRGAGSRVAAGSSRRRTRQAHAPQLEQAVGARRHQLRAGGQKVESQHRGEVALKGAQARAIAQAPQPDCLVACVRRLAGWGGVGQGEGRRGGPRGAGHAGMSGRGTEGSLKSGTRRRRQAHRGRRRQGEQAGRRQEGGASLTRGSCHRLVDRREGDSPHAALVSLQGQHWHQGGQAPHFGGAVLAARADHCARVVWLEQGLEEERGVC